MERKKTVYINFLNLGKPYDLSGRRGVVSIAGHLWNKGKVLAGLQRLYEQSAAWVCVAGNVDSILD